MEKQKMKNDRGITLIALVITIIILLILAGITLNLTLGEHGIIKKAQEAGKLYQNAAEDEEKKLGWMLNEVDNIISGTGNSNPTTIPTYGTIIKTRRQYKLYSRWNRKYNTSTSGV